MISQLLFVASLFATNVENIETVKTLNAQDWEEFSLYIDKAMAEWAVPGAVVLVLDQDKVLYQKTFGVEDINTSQPITMDTIFPLASLSKNLTALLVAKLVDEKQIEWDDPVYKYWPDFALATEELTKQTTVLDIMSQRTGLPHFSGDTFWNLQASKNEIKQVISRIEPVNPRGKHYSYQNWTIGLIGDMTEHITHKKFADLIYEKVLTPLGLKQTIVLEQVHSWWDGLKQKIKLWLHWDPLAIGHSRKYGKTISLGFMPHLFAFPASNGLASTGNDMLKLLKFHLNNTSFLSGVQFKKMRQQHVQIPSNGNKTLFPPDRITDNGYGIGWIVNKYADEDCLSHMAGMNGYRNSMTVLPKRKIAIVVLSNLGGLRTSFFPEVVTNYVLDKILQVKNPKNWQKEIFAHYLSLKKQFADANAEDKLNNPHPHGELKDYTGDYQSKLYGGISIKLESERLVLYYRGQRVILNHLNGNKFSFPGPELSKGFSHDDEGVVMFHDDGLYVSLLHEGNDPLFYKKHLGN